MRTLYESLLDDEDEILKDTEHNIIDKLRNCFTQSSIKRNKLRYEDHILYIDKTVIITICKDIPDFVHKVVLDDNIEEVVFVGELDHKTIEKIQINSSSISRNVGIYCKKVEGEVSDLNWNIDKLQINSDVKFKNCNFTTSETKFGALVFGFGSLKSIDNLKGFTICNPKRNQILINCIGSTSPALSKAMKSKKGKEELLNIVKDMLKYHKGYGYFGISRTKYISKVNNELIYKGK